MKTTAVCLPSPSKTHPLVQRALWITFFALLTGASAWVRIPLGFTPVPLTLQTFFVLASGVVLGRDGLYAMGLYLLLGGLGFPFFAGGESGFAYFLGATGGYLVGFVAAAALSGMWLRMNWAHTGFFGRSGRLFLLSLVIFVPGVLQLSWVTGLSLAQAFALGCAPFLFGDVVKVLLLAGMPTKVLR